DPGKWKAFWVKLNNTRVYSIFSTPNMLGGFLLMTLPFFLLPFQNIMKPFPSRRFLKPLFLYGFLAFIPVLTLILTRSRSALGLFLLSPMLVFFKTKKKLSLLLVLSTLLVISSPYYLKSFFTLLPPSFQSRLNYWSISERIIADHPWLGTGTGSFEHEFIKRLDWDEEITKYAHNHWLQLASEAGLPASAGVFFITVVLLVFIPGSSHAEKKRTPDPPPPSYRSFILPFFVFSLFSLFYPAFTTFPLEYSWLFSLGIIILFWVCSFFFLHLSHSFHEKYIDQAMHFAAILFFLQSLVEFNQDTMGLSFLFYCLLGNKISHLSSPPTSPRRLSANSFSSLLFIGGLIIFSCVSGNVLFVKAEKQIHKTELISAEKTLRRASCLCPFNPEVDLKKIELLLLQSPVEKKSAEAILDLFYKALIKSPRQYDIWFLLAKYAYHHPQLTLLKKQALHAVNQAIQLAPTNPRLYLLKAQILEQYQKKQEALSLYLFVLKQLQKEKHHLHYAFSLSEKEIEWIKHQTALILSEKTEQGAA
ncbi:MAG: O-antigen ligase family protein, partial [Candidatus Aureabacteria bacterium]|nr:O-antigen ligase family protein [Candidatus Auribacterota bacterium]